jgi:hypothetical protein
LTTSAVPTAQKKGVHRRRHSASAARKTYTRNASGSTMRCDETARPTTTPRKAATFGLMRSNAQRTKRTSAEHRSTHWSHARRLQKNWYGDDARSARAVVPASAPKRRRRPYAKARCAPVMHVSIARTWTIARPPKTR